MDDSQVTAPPITDDVTASPLPAAFDKQQVLSSAFQSVINNQTAQGKLTPSQDQTPQGTAPWDINSFFNYLKNNTAVVPPFPGASQDGNGWFAQADKAIGGAEGFEGRAYHGIYSPMRQTSDIFVKPGQVDGGTKSEVDIGYGFNLTGNGLDQSRQIFNKIGIDSDQFDKIVNGQASITPQQGVQLRQYMIYQANAQLDDMIGNAPLPDYQRAALVSMVYNFGAKGFANTGIPDLIKSGASPQDIAQKIRGASASQPALRGRRMSEANMFLGVQGAAQSMANTNVNQLPQS